MSERPEQIVHRYFAGLAESTFHSQLGVVDPNLIDYLTELLVRFIRSDVVHRLRSVTGRPLMTVAEMAAEAAQRWGHARRELHRHIGDFTLFWAGVYPEALRQHSSAAGDQFEDYCQQGKRSYHLAAQIEPCDETQPDSLVLIQLSDRFELCCYGLREVRRQWEEGDSEGPSGVILFN